MVAVALASAYTITSNRLASRYANAANAEKQSQEAYETTVSQSEQWEKRQQNSLFVTTELVTTYLICRTLRKSLANQSNSQP